MEGMRPSGAERQRERPSTGWALERSRKKLDQSLPIVGWVVSLIVGILFTALIGAELLSST
jgi:hypothetical protein